MNRNMNREMEKTQLSELSENEIRKIENTSVIVDGFHPRQLGYEKRETIAWSKYNKTEAKIDPASVCTKPFNDTEYSFVTVTLRDGRTTPMNTKNLFIPQ